MMQTNKYFSTGEIISVEKTNTNLQILKSIGSGTYGQVYKIKDLNNGEIFAAKADFEPRFL